MTFQVGDKVAVLGRSGVISLATVKTINKRSMRLSDGRQFGIDGRVYPHDVWSEYSVEHRKPEHIALFRHRKDLWMLTHMHSTEWSALPAETLHAIAELVRAAQKEGAKE